MGTTMIQAFRALHGNDSRMAALDALLQELSPYEWRAVTSKLNARPFHFDIVGNLPVEIVATIFTSLNTSAPFALQAVCRRWHTLLRSPHVYKQGLRAWYDDALAEDGDYHVYAAMARDIHRFRTGDRGHLVTHSAEIAPASLGLLALMEDTLLHVSADQRELTVRNLRTRTSWKTCGDARETIVATAASDRLVAYTTNRNVCYVSDLEGECKASFKLPSGMIKVLACSGSTVVCGGSHTHTIEVYIWDFDTRRGKSFRVGFDQPPFVHRGTRCERPDMLIIPSPASRTVTVCTSERCASMTCSHCGDASSCCIHYARFSFEGQILGDNKLNMPHFAGTSMINLQPVNRRGGYAIRVRVRGPGSVGIPDLKKEIVSLFFDTTANIFRDPKCPVTSPTSTGTVPQGVVWWKDTFYRLLSCDEFGTSAILLAYVGTSDESGFRPVASLIAGEEQEGVLRTWVAQCSSMGPHLLLNDKFAVVLDDTNSSICIVSFDSAR